MRSQLTVDHVKTQESPRLAVLPSLTRERAEDAIAEAYAMVFLVESGFAQQAEAARAFARSVRSVRRYQRRYAQGGMGRSVGPRVGAAAFTNNGGPYC